MFMNFVSILIYSNLKEIRYVVKNTFEILGHFFVRITKSIISIKKELL